MWQPQPGWHPLPSGTSMSTIGVWRAVVGDEPVAVKRPSITLTAPWKMHAEPASPEPPIASWHRMPSASQPCE